MNSILLRRKTTLPTVSVDVIVPYNCVKCDNFSHSFVAINYDLLKKMCQYFPSMLSPYLVMLVSFNVILVL